MLALSRKIGEELLIGKDIKLVVLGIKGKIVSLGIEAPRDIKILRKELLDKKEN